jgi:MraZ protein
MFIGEFTHSIDSKGRVALPAKFRPSLASGCVVTRGLDNSLIVYTSKEWEKMAKKLAKLPLTQADARAFSRLMLSGAMDIELDKQGRVVIPQYLRKYAGFKSDVVIIGLYNKIEMWDKATWETYSKDMESESAEIAEHLTDLGV